MERRVPKSSINTNSTLTQALREAVPGKKNFKGRGGARPGAGRKRGHRSKAQVDFEKLMRDIPEALEKRLGRKPTALECYQSVYQDFRVPYAVREQAKARALPFEASRLAPVQSFGGGSGSGGTNEQAINDARASLKRKFAKTVVVVPSGEVGGQPDSGRDQGAPVRVE